MSVLRAWSDLIHLKRRAQTPSRQSSQPLSFKNGNKPPAIFDSMRGRWLNSKCGSPLMHSRFYFHLTQTRAANNAEITLTMNVMTIKRYEVRPIFFMHSSLRGLIELVLFFRVYLGLNIVAVTHETLKRLCKNKKIVILRDF